jgi:hypothetical protein
MNGSRCFLLAGALTLTLGCGGPRLADTVDWELDFELTISDELHSPYAKGSLFTVYAVGIPDDEEHRYEVKSADTGVLFCASNGTAEAACEGTGDGEVDLLLSRAPASPSTQRPWRSCRPTPPGPSRARR